MKRLLAFALCMIMLLSVVSCSSDLAVTETESTAETQAATAEKEPAKTKEEEEKVGTDPITLPEGFSVGYSRKDITPISWPTLFYNGEYANSAHDPLQITCVALSDGENIALIVTVDMRGMNEKLIQSTKEYLTKKLAIEIPHENIFINNSHSHSAVDCNIDDPSVIRWKSQVYYKKLPVLADQAVRDLTPAEAYTGKGFTEGLTFVRRYFREDGAFTSIHYKETSNSPIVRHESEADNELRTIRFKREGGKKDVLMVNYQTHYGSAESIWPDQISADFVHAYRKAAEEQFDCLFSYCAGAGGNLVFNSRINGERKYPTFVDATSHFMDVIKTALDSEEKIETGKMQLAHSDYEGIHNSYPEELYNQAKDIVSAGNRTKEQADLVNKYGFHSRYQANGIVNSNSGKSTIVPFSAISFGDLAFCAFPYEMFDTNGKEVRDASPFKVTFICSLTNGSFGYIPSALAFPNGGYEVYSCRFRPGCGEEFAQEMVRLLNVCKNAG